MPVPLALPENGYVIESTDFFGTTPYFRRSMHLLSGAVSIGLSLPFMLALAGCGGGNAVDRTPISGTVTFQDQPVQDGQIRFAPETGTTSAVVIEPIADGRYATTTSGGLPPGKYRVEILAFDPKTPSPESAEDPPRKQLIPPNYNDQSKLRLTVAPGQQATTENYELAR